MSQQNPTNIILNAEYPSDLFGDMDRESADYQKTMTECSEMLFDYFENTFLNIDWSDTSIEFIQKMLRKSASGISFFHNCLIYIKKDVPVRIQKFSAALRSCNNIHIRTIEQITTILDHYSHVRLMQFSHNRLLALLNQISTEIQVSDDLMMEIMRITRFIKIHAKMGPTIIKFQDSISRLQGLFERLSLISILETSSELKAMIHDAKFDLILSRIDESENNFTAKKWDESSAKMRQAFEILITNMTRTVLGDKMWKAPVKDGLQVLLENGVIMDQQTLNFIKTREVGFYGFISVKAIHELCELSTPDTSSLISSEVEAELCKNLTISVMTYLLRNFLGSKFFKG